MSKRCCPDHDRLFSDWMKCGMAGMGPVHLCCRNCPQLKWYKQNQPTRPIAFYSELSDEEKAE